MAVGPAATGPCCCICYWSIVAIAVLLDCWLEISWGWMSDSPHGPGVVAGTCLVFVNHIPWHYILMCWLKSSPWYTGLAIWRGKTSLGIFVFYVCNTMLKFLLFACLRAEFVWAFCEICQTEQNRTSLCKGKCETLPVMLRWFICVETGGLCCHGNSSRFEPC